MMESMKSIQESMKFELQAYKQPVDFKSLKKDHVSFSGSPRKHYSDPEKLVMVVDPFSTGTFYYEFNLKDIACVEDLPSMVSPENNAITIVRVWVKKKSIGIRCTPFLVEDTFS